LTPPGNLAVAAVPAPASVLGLTVLEVVLRT
jgi:hypothetical protein